MILLSFSYSYSYSFSYFYSFSFSFSFSFNPFLVLALVLVLVLVLLLLLRARNLLFFCDEERLCGRRRHTHGWGRCVCHFNGSGSAGAGRRECIARSGQLPDHHIRIVVGEPHVEHSRNAIGDDTAAKSCPLAHLLDGHLNGIRCVLLAIEILAFCRGSGICRALVPRLGARRRRGKPIHEFLVLLVLLVLLVIIIVGIGRSCRVGHEYFCHPTVFSG